MALNFLDLPMAFTRNPQYQQNGFTALTNSLKRYQQPRDILQDKSAPLRARIASRQPSRVENIARSHKLDKKTTRTKNHSTRRRTEQATTWLPKPIMARVRQRMAANGWTKSYAVRKLVEIGDAHALGEEQATALRVMFEDVIKKRDQVRDRRFIALLLRIAFDAGQTRFLTTNILGRQQGVTEEIVKKNLELSAKRAKDNIINRSPQITELIKALDTWLENEPEDTTRG